MPLEPVEAALTRAVQAADTLGLDAAEARAVCRAIADRRGYLAELYVLALAGGTGVGKSSLLNALAGGEVSPSGARRPTTQAPIALVPAGQEEAAKPLLEWLGGAEVRTWDATGPSVAIVDLPDLDSIEPAHAARVDAILPRIDAVLWVTDPEKYDDAILHDRYLASWRPRLARQALVVNKSDRLGPRDAERICDDLRGRLRKEGLAEVPVIAASALADMTALRAWLLEGVSAKAIVTARLHQSAHASVRELGVAAGADGPLPPSPLTRAVDQEGAVRVARSAILDVVGPRGLRAQATADLRAEAAAAGGGPLQQVGVLLRRGSGAMAQDADPVGYLRRWRDRGQLDRAIASVRALMLTAATTLPAGLRRGVLASADPVAVGERLAHAVDASIQRAVVTHQRPHGGLWAAMGVLQLVATASLLAGAIWLAVLFVTGGSTPTASLELPLVGPMPTPAVLIIGGLLATFLLGRLLRWHGGRLGRRWADRLLGEISAGVSGTVTEAIEEPLATTDEARRALWTAVRDIEQAQAGADARRGA